MDSPVATQETRGTQKLRAREIVNWGTFSLVALASAWIFYAPLRNPGQLVPFVADDFFYYLKVAQNVAQGLDSTFNGITRTNGYHPLYFVLLVFICKFGAGLVGVFRGLWLLGVVATAATFLSARRLLERPDRGPLLINALALVFLIPCVHGFFLGMEGTLTVPLGLGLLLAFRSQPGDWTFGRSLGIGLLVAVTILSRLDAVFLVLLLLTFTLVRPKQRAGIGFRQLAGFAIGGGPLLAAYFVFNRLYFHTWMPISGTAKQLKSSPWPTPIAVKSGGVYSTFMAVFLVYLVVAFWLAWKWLAPAERVVLAAAAAFPYVQIGVLSFLSDWPLWPWYYYTLRFAMLAGLVLLMELPGAAWFSRRALWIQATAYGIALVLFLQVRWKQYPQMETISDVALRIQIFGRSHPGIYAMGGGAGVAAYLMGNPIVQTEGLMMDPAFLMHIRHQDNLLAVLRTYGVRYYIAYEILTPTSYDNQREGKCFLAEEPYNVGHTTLRMRAAFCGPPVADIPVSNMVVVHIYDLKKVAQEL